MAAPRAVKTEEFHLNAFLAVQSSHQGHFFNSLSLALDFSQRE